MGCFDIYCKVCGGPFTPYPSAYFPEMEGVDTKWLGEAVVEYKDGAKVDATGYDSYGRFKSTSGESLDVGLDELNGNVIVYHKQCEGKPSSNQFRQYQCQHFDIMSMIEHGKQHMLNKSHNN
jgi:hypothetical protein